MAATETAIRIQFFDYLFGNDNGYVCICTQKPHNRASFKQHFFQWPNERIELSSFVDQTHLNHNMWFCVNLLSKKERKKEYCKPTNLVWADLDACDPSIVEPIPQCIIQSSPMRYQAIWRMDRIIDPYTAEEFSKRLAYKYNQNGADPSGWDLTQLLRVPLTYNYKYAKEDEVPTVSLEQAAETLLPVEVFDLIEAPELLNEPPDSSEYPVPSIDELPDVENIIYKYQFSLRNTAFKELFFDAPPPSADWSRLLWRLINICVESGMSREEALTVAIASACNKYKRDGRPLKYLWREVLKADSQQKRLNAIAGQFKPLSMPELVTSDEIARMEPTIIDDYHSWAVEATDAVSEYHDLSAFILLSAVVAGGVKIGTSYGPMIPNLWGMILGDSTLTRKTTAMRMATDFLVEIDRDLVLATDGSVEGVLTGLSGRPHRVSIFFKDELSGFLDAINRKDYLAGMQETLTQLYDVPEFFTRRLRKETISIVNPIFIFFGGGIRDKIYSLVSDEHILSGFLPRFLVVSGEADLSKLRRTGPATTEISEKRNSLVAHFSNLYEWYSAATSTIALGDQEVQMSSYADAFLTTEAWERYGEIEAKLVDVAQSSPVSMYALPTFERLSRSLLKMSVLLAASRGAPDNGTVQATEADVAKAASYIQRWGTHTIDLISNAGRGTVQRQIDKILGMIQRNPGITRSKVMQAYHLRKREMDEIQDTLEDRGQVRVEKQGRGVSLWPM